MKCRIGQIGSQNLLSGSDGRGVSRSYLALSLVIRSSVQAYGRRGCTNITRRAHATFRRLSGNSKRLVGRSDCKHYRDVIEIRTGAEQGLSAGAPMVGSNLPGTGKTTTHSPNFSTLNRSSPNGRSRLPQGDSSRESLVASMKLKTHWSNSKDWQEGSL